MSLKDRVNLMREVQFVTNSFDQELQGTFYRYMNLSQKHQKYLKNLLFDKPEYQSIRSRVATFDKDGKIDESEQYKVDGVFWLASKLYDNWPFGRALYCNHDKSFVINVNNVDHLEISAV